MNSKGFSLIEVLIGLIILAIGLLAIAGMQITAIRGNDFSKNLTQATVLAQDRMEILKNRPFTHSDLNQGTYLEGVITNTIFTRSYVVTNLGSTMKMITVTVTWPNNNNPSNPHVVRLETIRAK